MKEKDENKQDEIKKNETNNGAGKPFYCQRDNKEKPKSACNVTSMIAALSAAGWPVGNFAPSGVQPEDALMRFIMTDAAALNMWRRMDPKGVIPPNQWHAVLAYGTNRFLKTLGFNSAPAVFREAVGAEEIVGAIKSGGAAVLSGVFPQEGTPLNHIVAAVGFGTDESGFYFIIDDPWGDYHTKYKNRDGKGIRLPLGDFNSMLKPRSAEKKWAHIIKRFEP